MDTDFNVLRKPNLSVNSVATRPATISNSCLGLARSFWENFFATGLEEEGGGGVGVAVVDLHAYLSSARIYFNHSKIFSSHAVCEQGKLTFSV